MDPVNPQQMKQLEQVQQLAQTLPGLLARRADLSQKMADVLSSGKADPKKLGEMQAALAQLDGSILAARNAATTLRSITGDAYETRTVASGIWSHQSRMSAKL